MYVLNTFLRLVRFIGYTFVGLVVGYTAGISGYTLSDLFSYFHRLFGF